jgi:hypothetical protein
VVRDVPAKSAIATRVPIKFVPFTLVDIPTGVPATSAESIASPTLAFTVNPWLVRVVRSVEDVAPDAIETTGL